MKINLRTTTLFFLFLFPLSYLQAAHIIGGELSYSCLGNGDYEITMKIYRDCQGNGAQFDGPGNGRMSIYNGSDLTNEFDRITMPNPVVTDIQPDINNPCLILPSNVCVEQGL